MSEIQLLSEMKVELVQSAGSDQMICDAARVSVSGTDDADHAVSHGLINYLMEHRHGSPFEHGLITFAIEAPIFVFREFHRHRAGWSYNEMSGRYRELPPRFWYPDEDRPLVNAGTSARPQLVLGSEAMSESTYWTLRKSYKTSWELYQILLGDGVAKEVARACLPVATYSQMFATCNPRSLMHFLGLRTHREDAAFVSHPQREIEQVAEQMESIFADLFPITHAAFNNHRRVAP